MDANREHVLNVLLARIRNRSTVAAKHIEMKDLDHDDIIILLMGPPTSGKTTFLEITAGTELVGRQKSEHPATSIWAFKLSVPGFPGSIVLVNTPGFSNRGLGDLGILRLISDWVNQAYSKGILVCGLIYFHRISEDSRMEGTSLRNWRAFEKICGTPFQNVVIATTMWGDVEPGVGHRRSDELRDFCGRDWPIKPFRRDHLTAADVLLPILQHTTPRKPLELQREISDLHLSLKQTAAARALFSQLEILYNQTEDDIRQTLQDMPLVGEERLIVLESKFHKLKDLEGHLLSRMKELKPDEETRPDDVIQRHILVTRVLGPLSRFLHLSNRPQNRN
jgi:hypothetical protein